MDPHDSLAQYAADVATVNKFMESGMNQVTFNYFAEDSLRPENIEEPTEAGQLEAKTWEATKEEVFPMPSEPKYNTIV